jgi:hypothetical protein
MKLITSLLLATLLSLATSAAIAACPDTNKTAGISKDGTHAPLEGVEPGAAASNAPQKDGATMPLASEEGGGNKDLATSQQDVEAQQDGEKTAAATANDSCKD